MSKAIFREAVLPIFCDLVSRGSTGFLSHAHPGSALLGASCSWVSTTHLS